MQQTQSNDPIEAEVAPFELKRRLMARADKAGAAGTIGRLLRDTPDLLEIMGNQNVAKIAVDCVELYRREALAALMAQIRPPKNTWLEIVLDSSHHRIGCLCIGTGAGSLAFYGAGCLEGREVIPKRMVLFRWETIWRPTINWIALENGTWSPSNGWLRRATCWMEEHLCGHAIEPNMGDQEGSDEMQGLLFGGMLMAIALSPLANPLRLATAA